MKPSHDVLTGLLSFIESPERTPTERDPRPPKALDRMSDDQLEHLATQANNMLESYTAGLHGIGSLMLAVGLQDKIDELLSSDIANVGWLITEMAGAIEGAQYIESNIRGHLQTRRESGVSI